MVWMIVPVEQTQISPVVSGPEYATQRGVAPVAVAVPVLVLPPAAVAV